MFFGTEAFWFFCLTFVSMHHNQLNTRVAYSNESASAGMPALVFTLPTSRGAVSAAVAVLKPSGIPSLMPNSSNAPNGNVIKSSISSNSVNRRDGYALKNEIIAEVTREEEEEEEEATTRQVSGEIITPEENDGNVRRRSTNVEGISSTSTTNSDKILIEDTVGGACGGDCDGVDGNVVDIGENSEISKDIEHIDTTLKLAAKHNPPIQGASSKQQQKNSKHSKNGRNSAKTISENFVWDFKENVGKLLENSAKKENRSNFMTNNAASGYASASASASHASPIPVNSGRSNTLGGVSDAATAIVTAVAQSHLTERRHLVPEKLQYTKEISIKQGRLVGIVRSFQSTSRLHPVDQYLGLPYAEAPTGSRRFMPPGTPLPWSGLKIARHLPPVCPQNLPNLSMQGSAKMSLGRYKHLIRLLPYLKNESEDCLYLNVYVPSGADGSQQVQLYPVIVYIHGESFEWNSGNAYDGSVLASYGEVIVVTVNYRLGLMGFMKPGMSDSIIANFGLLDQIAALHWIKENILSFGGDKDKVTLMGHGPGAACINYLMISPVAAGLFHRAILMSGSAMSDWAASNHSLQLTMQIAHALECPLNDDNEQMMSCLRSKRYEDLQKVPLTFPQFSTALGPIADGNVIPDRPYRAMSQYTELFSRYDLLFGITESESYHTLGALALEEGLRENERDNLLRFYMQSRYDIRPDLALAATLKKYNDMYNNPVRATNLEHRDVVLDILSDARIVGPLMQTGLFHAEVNRHNYMYVFGHNSAAGPHASLPHSIAGEELAFVFGAPLAPAGPFHGNNYSIQEKLLSEAVMAYWTNFAKTGNPKAPWRGTFLNLHGLEWDRYDLDWPEFNKKTQAYMNIGIPPSIGYKYRQIYMNFWNKELPDELNQIADIQQQPFLRGQYTPSGTQFIQNYPTRRQGTEVITGHMNKYGTRDNGAEDPVRTLKLLMQEAGRGIPIGSDVDTENMYSAPPTFGIAKKSEDEVFDIQAVPTNMRQQHHYHRLESERATEANRAGNAVIYGIRQTEGAQNNPIDMNRSDNTGNENDNDNDNDDENDNENDNEIGVNHGGDKEEVAKSESTIQLLIGLIVVFIVLNVIIYSTFLLKKKRKKQTSTTLGMQRKLGGILSYDGATDDELKRSKQTTQHDGDESYILDVVRKSNTYEAVRTLDRSPINGYKISRQLSTSTVDTHTKVSEWISNAAGGGCGNGGGTLIRFPKMTKKSNSPGFSTLRGSSVGVGVGGGGGTTTAGSFSSQPKRVSVAIDATPQARSNSILGQEPIEVTKLKAEGGKIIICEDVEVVDQELLTPQLSLDASDYMLVGKHSMNESSNVISPCHQYSRSDPVDLYYSNDVAFDDEKITSFMDDLDKFSDINVTSRDESMYAAHVEPLTPEQQLLAIKKRNYPKVLPTNRKIFTDDGMRETDSPPMTADMSTTSYKRNSLPPNSFLPTFFGKYITPPMPPPRTISTLDRRPTRQQQLQKHQQRRDSCDITTSPLRLAQDFMHEEEQEHEQEITQNTLIVGPIVPKTKVAGLAGDGNYSTLKRNAKDIASATLKCNEAQNNACSLHIANEAGTNDKQQQQQPQRPTALCLGSIGQATSTSTSTSTPTKSTAAFKSTSNGMEEESKLTNDKDAFHTTEKIYAIQAALPTTTTTTTPTSSLYSHISSRATTPSTAPATSPLMMPTAITMFDVEDTAKLRALKTEGRTNDEVNAGGEDDEKGDGDGSAIIYAQANKQAIKGNVTATKSNIPLRIPTPTPTPTPTTSTTTTTTVTALPEQNQSLSAVIKTPSLQNFEICNQDEAKATSSNPYPPQQLSSLMSPVTTTSSSVVNGTNTMATAATEAAAAAAISSSPSRIPQRNRSFNSQQQQRGRSDKVNVNNAASSVEQPEIGSPVVSSAMPQISLPQQVNSKACSRVSTVSSASSGDSAATSACSSSSYSSLSLSTSSSSSSTNTVRTELKQK